MDQGHWGHHPQQAWCNDWSASQLAASPQQLAAYAGELQARQRAIDEEAAELQAALKQAERDLATARSSREQVEKATQEMLGTLQVALKEDSVEGVGVVRACNQLVQDVAETEAQLDDLRREQEPLAAALAAERAAARFAEEKADADAEARRLEAARQSEESSSLLAALNLQLGDLKSQLGHLEEARGRVTLPDAAQLEEEVKVLRRQLTKAREQLAAAIVARKAKEEAAEDTMQKVSKAEARYTDGKLRHDELASREEAAERELLLLEPEVKLVRTEIEAETRRSKDVEALCETIVCGLMFVVLYSASGIL
jgi:chromosome segregation ATPase